MNLSSVKLIVFDMDGTLLNDQHKASERFFKQYKLLKDKGIHFAAASGRQHQSIRHALEPIKDEINIIGENGGVLQYNKQTSTMLKLDDQIIKQSLDIIRRLEDAYIVLCGRKSAYVEHSKPEFLSTIRNYYQEVKQVEDLKTIADDDILKIAVYHFVSSEQYVLPYVQELQGLVKYIVSAQNWLDISPMASNKGYALKILQNKLGISQEETMVFGDYNNDLEMLQLGDHSFAMQNAHPEVKKIAKYTTKSNNEEGVEHVLDMLIATL